MTTPCELTAPEREHFTETVRALERRIDEVCAERDRLGASLELVVVARRAVTAERDALADRLAIAERAAREEREARIAAEGALREAAHYLRFGDGQQQGLVVKGGAPTTRGAALTATDGALSGGKGEER